MNFDELQKEWNNFNQTGLQGKHPDKLQQIIGFGTSKVVTNINKKLFRDMVITAVAATISALGIILFYLVLDPEMHPQINLSKIVPVQLLGFTIFLILFILGWAEYRLINRQFTASSIHQHLTGMIADLRKFERTFLAIILPLLLATFYVELNYFIEGNELRMVLLKTGITTILTAGSFLIIRKYYQWSVGPYIQKLVSYQTELEAS